MIYAKIATDKTVTFGPVLAADGTMSNGALAYTDAKIFKNGTDGALNASATFTHKYEGVYALLLKAADLDAVGCYEVVLNKNPLSAAPVKITVLAANVYDWLFGTVAPATTTITELTNSRAKYANGSVWIGPSANTNTVSYVDGIITNPVSTIAAAKAVADALGMRRFEVIRTGTVQVGAALAGYRLSGVGWSCTTTGGSQDVGTTAFIGAQVVGGTFASTTGTINWENCEFATGVAIGVSNLHHCEFQGTLTLSTAGQYDFIDCSSVVAGTGTPVFAIPAGTIYVSFRRWSGGIRITGITSGTIISIDMVSGGTVTLEGADGNVQVRGLVAGITDSRTGTPTLGQNAAINITKINTECDTALADYDAPTNTEMVAAFTQIKGATWATTDTLEAIRDRGDAAWLTATGFSTHSAADVVTAMGTGSTLTALAPSATALSTAVWTNTKAGYIDAAISTAGGGGLTAAAIADAVWDEVATEHIDTGKAGAQLWTVINTLTSGSAINVTTTTTIIETE